MAVFFNTILLLLQIPFVASYNCRHTNGTETNHVASCTCGTTDCTSESGHYCIASSNSCSKRPSRNCVVSTQILLNSDLNNQSLYATGLVKMAARTTVGGNIRSVTSVSLAANAIVGGNVEAGAVTTLGADAVVAGSITTGTLVTLGVTAIVHRSILAGTTATIGVGAKIHGGLVAGTTITLDATVEVGGDVLAGSTLTVGASSIFHGDVHAGTTTSIGAACIFNGSLIANSELIPPTPAIIPSQENEITSLQTTLKSLGGTETELLSTSFGTIDETLIAGIYSTINDLTIANGKTLTLDGQGADGTWLFNIANYLSLGTEAKIILFNVTNTR